MSHEVFRESERTYQNQQKEGSHVSKARGSARRKYWSRWRILRALLLLAIMIALIYEERTSAAQSRIFSAVSSRISFWMEKGSSGTIVFPTSGPLNIRRGYTLLPSFTRNLLDDGFHVVEQARNSSVLQVISRWQIPAPYREQPVVGLVIRDQNGNILYNAGKEGRAFQSYEEIPPLVVRSLLLVENRDLDDATIATRSPVVDWGRMSKAGLFYVGNKFGMPFRVEGGSTLATQIEKYQYSRNGRTNSAADKLRQMIAASLLAYQGGPDTRPERRRIVLDYLNSVPLAAANGYGEVFGVGNGLRVWFGVDLADATANLNGGSEAGRELALRQFLTLICAARAPSFYLRQDRPALEARTDFYIRELQSTGAITPEFASGMRTLSATFVSPDRSPAIPYSRKKATTAIRTHLLNVLGIRDFYDLDNLNVVADTTLNADLQNQVVSLFENLKDKDFINSHGLRSEHTLLYGDPKLITYGFTLYERTSTGNKLRVQADNLDQPFDLNEGMKLELGSTAKLRTLAHYLEVITSLYQQIHSEGHPITPGNRVTNDPITQWVLDTLKKNPGIDLDAFLQSALDRKYSGSPGSFFTGGGIHSFANFDSIEDSVFYTLRDGFAKSVNLVYVRLLRDLVLYHEARLPYDTAAILSQPDNPDRLRFLNEFARDESMDSLQTAFQAYRGLSETSIVDRILGTRKNSARPMSMLYLAWNPKGNAESLGKWLESQGIDTTPEDAEALLDSYDPYRLSISDYGYLLDRNPLDVWCAGVLAKHPDTTWTALLNNSAKTRELSSEWLFKTRNRGAQDRRLMIRFEQDAFAAMTPDWQRLGYPFEHLIPSLATAIGSSADRPVALAQLMGVILNNGVRQAIVREQSIHFAGGTPYETVLEPEVKPGETVMDPHVAAALHGVLLGVVQHGTATSLNGLFHAPDGSPVEVGGKTGSGDNRFETFNRGGGVRTSRAVSRTGTFVFYIGTRYFGVITAYVGEEIASRYGFTSALPVAVLRQLAPAMTPLLGNVPRK